MRRKQNVFVFRVLFAIRSLYGRFFADLPWVFVPFLGARERRRRSLSSPFHRRRRRRNSERRTSVSFDAAMGEDGDAARVKVGEGG